LEAERIIAKSPRVSIKQAFQNGIIENAHLWMDVLSKRHLTTYIYDQELAVKLVEEIQELYLVTYMANY